MRGNDDEPDEGNTRRGTRRHLYSGNPSSSDDYLLGSTPQLIIS